MNPQRTFFHTRAAQIAIQSLDRIRDEVIIGMVVANPGIGKTQAINYWRRKQGAGVRHVRIEADVLTSCRPILNALARALGVKVQGIQLAAGKSAIEDALAKDPMMVIVDEADLLTVRTFELLRSIWDRVSAMRGMDGERGFSLALFGAPKLREMLERDALERLRRRLFHKTELPVLNRTEIEKVLQKWPGLKIDLEALAKLEIVSHGPFGWLNVIVPVAQKMAARNGRVLTPTIQKAVRKYLVGVPEE